MMTFSEAGSPDTQRTLSMGTLTSLSPDINNVTTIMHQHAEPRFIFYMVSELVLPFAGIVAVKGFLWVNSDIFDENLKC